MVKRTDFSLIFVVKDNKVLLGRKTRGSDKDMWNGFGGHVEDNETVRECAVRELKEECSLVANVLKHVGVLKTKQLNQAKDRIVDIFTCSDFSGNAMPSEEMCPIQWFKFEKMPLLEMWPDTKVWIKHILQNNFFRVDCIYKPDRTIERINVVLFAAKNCN